MRNLRFTLAILLMITGGCMRLVEEPDGPAFEGGEGDDCYSNAACAEGYFCDTSGVAVEGVCRPDGECSTDFHCEEGEECVEGLCQMAECTWQNEAPCGIYGCDTDDNQCYTSCETDGQCGTLTDGSRAVCRGGECIDPSCTADNAAVVCNGYACDEVLGECYTSSDSCSVRGCAAGYVCDVLYCKKACSGPGECGDYSCDTDEGVCRQTCFDHDECENGTVCRNARCEAM